MQSGAKNCVLCSAELEQKVKTRGKKKPLVFVSFSKNCVQIQPKAKKCGENVSATLSSVCTIIYLTLLTGAGIVCFCCFR